MFAIQAIVMPVLDILVFISFKIERRVVSAWRLDYVEYTMFGPKERFQLIALRVMKRHKILT